VAEINAKKMQADEQTSQETKTPEDDFLNDDPSARKASAPTSQRIATLFPE